MVLRRKFSLGTVENTEKPVYLPGPKKKKYPQDRAPWSLGENLPSGPCFLVPRRKFVSGMQVSVHFGPILGYNT